MATQLQKTTHLDWALRIGSFLMSLIIMVSSWFLKEAWFRINAVEDEVHQLEVKGAETSGNRFTSNDWATQKSLLDTERIAMDRRIIRLEESIPTIKETLVEIKNNQVEIKKTLEK